MSDDMKFVSAVSLQKYYGSDKFSGPFCNHLYTSFVAPKYLGYGKMREDGTAGSVGKDQDPNMKFEPQLVLSNSNKSTKWHECDWCSGLFCKLTRCSKVLTTW